ncbi:Probable secreted protein containing HslJ-like protein [Nitrococcus mobilis Nb-231]|uniref:Probable secreted protein containing HslJ-like protein n=1 Tax=Nitrococcus mobilis Nb-231 TaxID=314278 RepID=A4BVR8_9GAMM|nr:Probable secreted protein containing HslJ-like protein [Nitrococcus mobilis Nb-231]
MYFIAGAGVLCVTHFAGLAWAHLLAATAVGGVAPNSLANGAYPECCKIAPASVAERLPFKAAGNEPGWSLTISDERMELKWNYGQDRMSTPRPPRHPTRAGYRYATSTAAHAVTVHVADRLCRDSMTGLPYPRRVTVQIDAETLTGCGGSPVSLLRGDEWVVEDIAGKGLIDSSRVTLNFGANGRLAGRAGCNTYHAHYELTGERLIVGDIATTRRACAPALERQETVFLRLLRAAHGFNLTTDGALVIRTATGTSIEARR